MLSSSKKASRYQRTQQALRKNLKKRKLFQIRINREKKQKK